MRRGGALGSPHCVNLGPNHEGLRRGRDSKSEEPGFRGPLFQPRLHRGEQGGPSEVPAPRLEHGPRGQWQTLTCVKRDMTTTGINTREALPVGQVLSQRLAGGVIVLIVTVARRGKHHHAPPLPVWKLSPGEVEWLTCRRSLGKSDSESSVQTPD